MRKTINLILVFLISLYVVNIKGQENFSKITSDFETWTSAELNTKLSKNLSVALEQGLRLSKNSSQLDQALTEANISFQVFKKIELGAGFRYIYDSSNEGSYHNDFRFNFDASYKEKINRLSLKFRLRYQNKNELGYRISEGDLNKSDFRFRLSSTYNIKKWKLDPKLSTELFRSNNSGQFEKIRFSFGTEYNLKNSGQIGAFYRVERELNVGLPKTTYITGLKYTYTFKTY